MNFVLEFCFTLSVIRCIQVFVIQQPKVIVIPFGADMAFVACFFHSAARLVVVGAVVVAAMW